jgi:hypothetical protein
MLSENFHRTAQEMNSNYEGKICNREGRKEILATQSLQSLKRMFRWALVLKLCTR